ncbi:MAG: hypothetical protein KDB33_04620, partial [Acidimicrobiales bacterium]|nr:hypothetical protein [Acidimicrobiales bacterium]
MTDDEILTSIRTRAALRRRARLAGLAAMATVLLVGGLSLAGLARSPEDAELVFAYRDESGTTTTAPSIPTDNDDVAKVLLTGDSFGYTLGYGFEGNPQTSAVAVWNQAELYCGVVPLARPAHGDEQCLPWHERAQRTLVEYGPDVVVHALGPTDVFDAVGADGQPVSVESEEYARQFQQELEEYARVVRANGARFVVLLATPFDGDATVMPPELTTARRDRVDRINALAVQALTDDAADWGHEPVIDLWTWMCPGEESGEPCRTAEDGGPLRPDGVHFDEKTARPAAAALVEPLLIVHRGVVPSGDPDELTPYGLDSNDSQATETTSNPDTT